VNSTAVPHTATSDTVGGWDTGIVNGSSSAAVTFNTAGIYPYHCAIHPYMHGTVYVGVTPQIALPSVANAAYGGYTTGAYIENIGSAAASVHVRYFDQAGSPVGTGDDRSSLAPKATWTVSQANGLSFSPGAAGSAIVYSDQPVAAFVNEFAPNGGDASSYTGIRIGFGNGIGPTLYAPAIANNAYGGYTTGLGIINMGQTTDIMIEYRGADGTVAQTQTLTAVPPHAYRDAYSGTAGLPDHFAGTATITVVSPMPGLSSIAAVVNEVGPHGQFSSYDAIANATPVLYLPTMLNGAYGGYYTGIGVRNIANAVGTVSITYRDAAGTAVKTVNSMPIAANGYLAIYQGDPTVGPPPSATGYSATITANVAIVAVVNEVAPPTATAGGGQQFTSYNVSAANDLVVNAPLTENAGSDGWSTGLGIMNTGGLSGNFTIRYFDAASGMLLTSKTVTIPGQAFAGVYTPDDLPAGTRASASITGPSPMSSVAVIVNERSATSFMSYGGQ
jgi:hypothetical protein